MLVILHCDSHFRARFIIDFDHRSMNYVWERNRGDINMGMSGHEHRGNMAMEFLFGNIHNQARLDLGLLAGTRLFSLLVSVLVLLVIVFQLFIVKV